MKTLMTVTLILFGAIWIFYATMIPNTMRIRALSDAMYLEAKLKAWFTEKALEGKLQESDVAEIFPEGYSLRFGGENPDRNFEEKISDISVSSAPPAWPGVLSILIGCAGAGSCIRSGKSRQTEPSSIRRKQS